jgi:stearoyl-CoA desaturase (delta-9 desaturase)
MRKKHPEMIRKSKTLDFSDLLSDPCVKAQEEHYYLMYFVFAFSIPIVIPVLVWGESWFNSFLINYVLRYITTLHCTWFVNSTAHMFGAKPYNPKISPVENHWVSFGTFGEGYHNYHHTFPWDYATSEVAYTLNVSKIFIEVCHLLGLAYNLKRPTYDMIQRQKNKHITPREVRKAEVSGPSL